MRTQKKTSLSTAFLGHILGKFHSPFHRQLSLSNSFGHTRHRGTVDLVNSPKLIVAAFWKRAWGLNWGIDIERFVSICIYMYIYIYVFFVFIYLYIYIFIYLYIYIFIFIKVNKQKYIYRTCVHMTIQMYVLCMWNEGFSNCSWVEVDCWTRAFELHDLDGFVSAPCNLEVLRLLMLIVLKLFGTPFLTFKGFLETWLGH